MGYKLSKPYILKILDSKIQSKMTYADHNGISKMFEIGARDIQELITVSDEESAGAWSVAKAEAIIMNLLQTYLKQAKSKGKARPTDIDQNLLDNIIPYVRASSEKTSYVNPLQTVLKLLWSTLNCKNIPVTDLDEAVSQLGGSASAELFEGEGAAMPGRAILEFVSEGGAGKWFGTVATTTLEARQGEIEVAKEVAARVQNLEEMREKEADLNTVLDKMSKFHDEFQKIQKRKRNENPFGSTQLKTIRVEMSTTEKVISSRVKAELTLRVAQALSLFNEASENEGYVQVGELRGRLMISKIQDILKPGTIVSCSCWSVISDHEKSLQNYTSMVDLMSNGIGFLLSKTKAYANTTVTEIEDLGPVEPWLLKLGLEPEVVDNTWKKKVVAPCANLALGRLRKANALMKQFLEECREGKFASPISDELLELLPPGSELKNFVNSFISLTGACASVLLSGNKAAPDKLNDVKSQHREFTSKITALGQDSGASISIEGFDLDFKGVAEFVESLGSQLQAVQQGFAQKIEKKVNAAIAKADKLLATIEAAVGDADDGKTDRVATFRSKMKSNGSALAKVQAELKGYLGEMEKAGLHLNTVSDEKTELFSKAHAAEQTCLKLTCTYVALTLYANPELQGNTKAAKTIKENLQATLASLDACSGKDIFATHIADMKELYREY